MKILITGACGFLGCNMTNEAIKRGHTVVGMDNLSRKEVENNLHYLEKTYKDKFQFVWGDVRKTTDFGKLPKVDAIIHLAANPSVVKSIEYPGIDFDTNVIGTVNALNFARVIGARFIYASTNKVYSDIINKVPVVEKEKRLEWVNKNIQGLSKNLCYGVDYGDNLYDSINENFPLSGFGKYGHSMYGTCFDKDTQILTDNGWKYFYELDGKEKVATLKVNVERNIKRERGKLGRWKKGEKSAGNDQTLEFQKILKVHRFDFDGKMFCQKNKRLDVMVTPDHNLLVSWGCSKEKLNCPRLVSAEKTFNKAISYLVGTEYKGGKKLDYFKLPKIIKQNGYCPDKNIGTKKIKINNWLRFLGWYLSEGSYYKTNSGNYNIVLSSKTRKREAKKIFKDIGFNSCISGTNITASNKQLFNYVKRFGKAKDKYIPKEIKNLTVKRLKILLKNLLNGDGNKNGNGYRYTSKSKRLADDVQEIAIKCGWSANIRMDSGVYRVMICLTRTVQCNLVKGGSSWKKHKGKVYCVSVSNKTVLVRRNGMPYFSGNSKLCGELYCQEYHIQFKIPMVIFRMSCIYGLFQKGVQEQAWVDWFLRQIIANKEITLFGTGKQVRDVLDGRDTARAYLDALENMDKVNGEIFTLGGGSENTYSLLEAIELIEKLTGKKAKIKFDKKRPADQDIYISSIGKVKEKLNWEPSISLEQGIKDMIGQYDYDKTVELANEI